MRLSEIKNDLAKITYNPSEVNLLLADFLLIEDNNQSLVSQIISIESNEEEGYTNAALVKFVLAIDKSLCLSTYNGYTPSKDSKILYVEPGEIVQLLKSDDRNMLWGEIAAHPDCKVNLSLSLLDNKPYIQSDKSENTQAIFDAIVTGLKKNNETLIAIDFDTTFKNFEDIKITVGQDLKLPLSYEILDFIYQNDLKDCPVEERGYVQDILIDIQNYVKSTEEGFIPFDVFKSVVDEQYASNPTSVGLILLRNKLIKYADDGILAQSKDDFEKINTIISENKAVLIDATDMNENWQRILVEFLSSNIKQNCYLALNFTEDNSTKKIISNLYMNESIKPISFSSYTYKHSTTLKALARNLVLALPMKQTDDFAGYNSFLHKLNENEFVVWGQATLYIPLILTPPMPKTTEIPKEIDFQIKKDVDEIFTAQVEDAQPEEPIRIITPQEPVFLDDSSAAQEPSLEEPETEEETTDIEDDNTTQAFEAIDNAETSSSVNIEIESVISPPIKEVNETGETETGEPEMVFMANPPDNDDSMLEELNFDMPESTPESITIEEEAPEPDEVFEPIPQMIEPESSPISLNIAQAPALNAGADSKPFTPIPIYQAQTTTDNSSVVHKFNEGDTVFHPKYGRGVIEKNIAYGAKSLCSIQFDNIGRRLLDPDLAELSKQ